MKKWTDGALDKLAAMARIRAIAMLHSSHGARANRAASCASWS
jgi:hypothetical protein